MRKPHALIFDLGNVLLPIDLDKTYEAFAMYSTKYSAEDIKLITQNEHLWSKYEAGLQSDAEFEMFIIDRLQLTCNSEQFRVAFNSLLLSFDETLCQYIKSLKSSFPIYLLSNTSNIHARLFLNLEYPNYNLFDAFNRVHLSFEMGVVKPDIAIYQQVVITNQLHDHHIIFFDDNKHNIESALNFGWDAILIDPQNSQHQIQQHIETLC
jgi:putative hydrolase of the HAD superfamily